MSKRQMHQVSDSDDDTSGCDNKSSPQCSSFKKKRTEHNPACTIEAAVTSDEFSKMSSTRSTEKHVSKALRPSKALSMQNHSSLFKFGSQQQQQEEIELTPKSFKVIEAPKRASRKPEYGMFAYILDCSPSTHNDLETFAYYILKRNVIDTFMRMRFQKNVKHHAVVLSCCTEHTDNVSNREQPKTLNEHCVELLPTAELTLEQIRAMANGAAAPKSENEQFSNVIAGLLTAADLITRHQADSETYERIEFTLFSDLNFDPSAPSFDKMSRVLNQLFSTVFLGAKLTLISNEDAMKRERYRTRLEYLRNSNIDIETMSYTDAVKRSERWTMAEQVPTTFKASIKLFEQEVPIEAFLLCNEKNVSELKVYLEKVVPGKAHHDEYVHVPKSALRKEKQWVKLTNDGHYMKRDDGRLVTVDSERTAMAFRFGTTAVPTEKELTEYIKSESCHKGYVVKGWYPTHEFALFVSGGKGYRVFASGTDCVAFDCLLTLCANKGFSLLVEYAYRAQLEPKPGVLIPHMAKRCFIFYTLVFEDNLNYLPRYDPVASVRPTTGKMEKICDFFANFRLAQLELKYDPKTQQLIEDCWASELGSNEWKYHQRFADVNFKLDPEFRDEVHSFKQNCDGYVRRLPIQKKNLEHAELDDDRIVFNVEPLDDKQIERVEAKNFKSLFNY